MRSPVEELEESIIKDNEPALLFMGETLADYGREKALSLALSHGSFRVVQHLILVAHAPLSDENANSLLSWLIHNPNHHRNVKFLQALIEKGIKIDRLIDGVSVNLLQYAMMANNVPAVKCLVENGAGFEPRENFDKALKLTMERDNVGVLLYLLKNTNFCDENNKKDICAWTILNKKDEVLALLIQKGVDGNTFVDEEKTMRALHYAALLGNYSAVGLLKAATPHFETEGNNPLGYVSENEKMPIFEFEKSILIIMTYFLQRYGLLDEKALAERHKEINQNMEGLRDAQISFLAFSFRVVMQAEWVTDVQEDRGFMHHAIENARQHCHEQDGLVYGAQASLLKLRKQVEYSPLNTIHRDARSLLASYMDNQTLGRYARTCSLFSKETQQLRATRKATHHTFRVTVFGDRGATRRFFQGKEQDRDGYYFTRIRTNQGVADFKVLEYNFDEGEYSSEIGDYHFYECDAAVLVTTDPTNQGLMLNFERDLSMIQGRCAGSLDNNFPVIWLEFKNSFDHRGIQANPINVRYQYIGALSMTETIWGIMVFSQLFKSIMKIRNLQEKQKPSASVELVRIDEPQKKCSVM